MIYGSKPDFKIVSQQKVVLTLKPDSMKPIGKRPLVVITAKTFTCHGKYLLVALQRLKILEVLNGDICFSRYFALYSQSFFCGGFRACDF